jgi:hypothetical protein
MPTHDIQDSNVSDDLIETGPSVPGTEEEDSQGSKNHKQDPSLRTITSLISAVQKHLHVGFPISQQEADVASGLVSTRYQERLRALTALATLLVRDTEVTAVAIMQPIPLALVACTSERGCQLTDLVATRNPRNLSEQTNNGDIDVSLPREELNPADPLDYLHRHW